MTSVPEGAPKRILILTTEYPATYGGLGAHVYELSGGLGSVGIQVSVWAFAPNVSKAKEHPNVKIEAIPASSKGSGGSSVVGRLIAFNEDLVARGRALLDSGAPRPEVIHCHDGFFFEAAKKLGEMFSAPVVVTCHLLNEPCARWWGQIPASDVVQLERVFLQEAKHVIAVSEAMRNVIVEAYPRSETTVHVVHNGLDPFPFQRDDSKSETVQKLRLLVAPEGERVILFAGRLAPQKGLTSLLQSIPEVIAAVGDVKYVVAGSPESVEASAMVNDVFRDRPSLRSRIKMLGKISRRQLASLYQLTSLAAVPSLFEPFGYAALEAMAAGVPVVATRIGGLAEIVRDGIDGLLVTPHRTTDGRIEVDPKQLAQAQIRILQDSALARSMGEAGERRAVEEFSFRHMTHKTIDVYLSALGTRAGVAAKGVGT